MSRIRIACVINKYLSKFRKIMAYDLKSESEVKEFIHNLGIEYRFGCYSEKKPEVCHLLGDYLEAIKRDFPKAGRVYKNNCDEFNYARSCYKFGNFTLLGKGLQKENHLEAYQYFEKGCNLNDSDACLHQGLLLIADNFKKSVHKDVKKGMSVLEKACNNNNPNACYYLSGMYIAGVKKEKDKVDGKKTSTDDKTTPTKEEYLVEKDMKQAFKYSLQGCNLQNMYSCANLSQMYAKGEGVEKNAELAEKYKKIALGMQDEIMRQQPTLTFQEGLKKT